MVISAEPLIYGLIFLAVLALVQGIYLTVFGKSILLNEFLPTHRDRRNFANFQAKDRRLEQLAKAEGMLSTVQHTGSA